MFADEPVAPTPINARTTTSLKLGVYYTYRDVTGTPATVADVLQRLRPIRLSEVIRLVTMLSAWHNSEKPELEAQLRMAREFLDAPLYGALVQHLQTPGVFPGAIFHSRQLRLLLQFAALVCKEDAESMENAAMCFAIGECSLMATDILFQIEPKDSPTGQSRDELNDWYATTIIPLGEYEAGLEILARAREFWFEIPKLEAIQKRFQQAGQLPFDAAFEARYGTSLWEYYLILLTIHLHFRTREEVDKVALPLLDHYAYLVPTYSPQDVAKVVRDISQRPDELAIRLLSTPRQNWAMDATPFRTHPLIEVFPGRHACPDKHSLLRTLTDKIYFLLKEAYPNNEFLKLFGYVFEDYAIRSLRQHQYEGDVLTRTFYANPRFAGKKPDEAADAIVSDGETAIVFECKARLLTTREKFSGIREALLTGIRDILAKRKQGDKKGAGQFADTLPRMLKGESILAGSNKAADFSGCKLLIPVIVTYEESLGLEAVRQIAEREFLKALREKDASTEKIGPLLVLTVGEIEVLESLTRKYGLIHLLKEYASHVLQHPDYHVGGFSKFLRESGYQMDAHVGPSLVQQKQQKAFDEAHAAIEQRMTAAEHQAATPPAECAGLNPT